MGIDEDAGMFSAITDGLSSLLKYSNPEAHKEEVYRAGVTAGYTKETDKIESSGIEKNESIYADGLMVGLGIESKDEYAQIISESEKRQKEQSRSLRRLVKSMNFGISYGMESNQLQNHMVDYSESDCLCTLNLHKALNGKEEENA